MAAPDPAGVLSSSAGVNATIQGALRQAIMPPASPAPAANQASPIFGSWSGGGLLTGMILAAAFLAYFYKRIL